MKEFACWTRLFSSRNKILTHRKHFQPIGSFSLCYVQCLAPPFLLCICKGGTLKIHLKRYTMLPMVLECFRWLSHVLLEENTFCATNVSHNQCRTYLTCGKTFAHVVDSGTTPSRFVERGAKPSWISLKMGNAFQISDFRRAVRLP